jgi:hypothetical protein
MRAIERVTEERRILIIETGNESQSDKRKKEGKRDREWAIQLKISTLFYSLPRNGRNRLECFIRL